VNFTPAWILASFLVGTVGFGIFVYGKKQSRLPQLVAGILLLAASWLVSSPAWMVACAVLVIGALWYGTRAGF
jgi:hypothetical protein